MSSESFHEEVVVAAMYRFTRLADYQAIKDPLLAHCLELGITGTILLAQEGINATVAGSRNGIDSLLTYLRGDSRLRDLTCKESFAEQSPFHRIKIKLKNEIVSMGIPDTDPNEVNGKRVDAQQWNALIGDSNVLVIDTRNDYENGIGTFANAVSPRTKTFREFPAYVSKELDAQKHRPIAMFCTGGIRCEKATNFLIKQGFTDVYHLDGGILKYLETVDPDESMWHGECFVFDNRVAVGADLKQGKHVQCFACRRPVSELDQQSAHYQKGISCPQCIDKVSVDKKHRLAERQRQIQLARARNEQHRGTTLRK